MYGYVYETTNLINGRKYISKHKGEFDPWYHGSGKLIWQAYDKYGYDNFETKMLKECDSKEELNESEKYFIRINNAVESHEYYNIARGGDGGDCTGGDSKRHAELTRLGMLKHGAYKKIRLKKIGQKWSQASRDKASESQRRSYREHPERREKISHGLLGNKNNLGLKHSDDHRRHISESNKISQNTYQSKYNIAQGRGTSMLREFTILKLEYSTPELWDSNRYKINYKRCYCSEYFLSYFDDWNDFINKCLSRI